MSGGSQDQARILQVLLSNMNSFTFGQQPFRLPALTPMWGNPAPALDMGVLPLAITQVEHP